MTVRLLYAGKSSAPTHPALRWVQYVFLAIAILGLGYWGFAYLDRYGYQAYENWTFDRSLHQDQGTEASARAKAGTDLSKKPAPPGLPSLIGRLSIPRLELSAIVQEGVDDSTLRHAVGHIPETPRPGESGNVALAGHRDTFFRGLKAIRKNDSITLATLNADYEYKVESLKIVNPDNVEVLAPSKGDVLTLVTCYPFYYVGSAPRRFIVRARLVASNPRQPRSS